MLVKSWLSIKTVKSLNPHNSFRDWIMSPVKKRPCLLVSCWNNKQSQNISVFEHIISYFSLSKTQKSRRFPGLGLLAAQVRETGRNTRCLFKPLSRTRPFICNKVKVKVKLVSSVQLFETPWTVAHQVPLSMGFPRQEYWSGLPFPSPGDFPNPGIDPRSPALWTEPLPSEPPGNPALSCMKNLSVLQENMLTASLEAPGRPGL